MSPQYQIHGSERRELKKELASLKSYARNFYYYHQLDKDMTSFYGGTSDYPMSDSKADYRYNIVIVKIGKLEEKLSRPYQLNSL